MRSHRLRREIIGSVLTNELINRMAVNFIGKMQTETGASVAEVVRAFAAVYKAYQFGRIFNDVDGRTFEQPADRFNVLRKIELTIENQTSTLIRRGLEDDLDEEVARLRAYPDAQVTDLKRELGID